ncbi:MAG TPA: nicotinate-nucleotide adenylyltransferase [Actinomycetota bacterium]|nr:nicotinate-nucleotide adenylyltransferase [Actinomycetota bacterium]
MTGDAGRPRRIGLMGGTFDPIHHGHLRCAEEARVQFGLDEVVFVPAGDPWQKTGVSPAEDRYLLTMLATASNPHFSVSRLEIDRGGPTYTVDTLRTFRAFYDGSAELFFITGTDAVAAILSWKDPEETLDLAHFIAANRPGYQINEEQQSLFRGRVSVMEMPALEISSQEIRRRVGQGQAIRYLVPDEVVRYIAERSLYRSHQAPSG